MKKLSLLQRKFTLNFYRINFLKSINQSKHNFKTMLLYTMQVSPKLYSKNSAYNHCRIPQYPLTSIRSNICSLCKKTHSFETSKAHDNGKKQRKKKQALKQTIQEAFTEFTADNEWDLPTRLLTSMPARLNAVKLVRGKQIRY